MTWRPLPDPAEEDRPHQLARSLDDVARSIGAPPVEALSVVFSRWEEVVGAAVAAHCRPVSLVRSTLIVSVDNPAWATQLKYLRASVLDRIAKIAGPDVATRLEVRVARE
jgi:predicted nucleic acid-binding Zn ribbon protein